MPKITGQQRASLVITWIKRGREGNKEDFIRRVCEAKGIEYVAPVKIVRSVLK